MAVRGETAAGASLRRSSINSVSLSDRDAEEQAPAGGYGGPTTPLLAKLSVPATPPAAAPAKRVMLTQLAGLRFLATTWILCGHYAQGERPGAPRGLFALLNRGYVPVGFYIVLSGFITHYAYREKDIGTAREYAKYLARRLGRVATSYYAAMLAALVIRYAFEPPGNPISLINWGYVALQLSMTQMWAPWVVITGNVCFQATANVGLNAFGWTISTLVLSWVCYPPLAALVRWASGRGKWWLVSLGLLVWLAVMSPVVVCTGVLERPALDRQAAVNRCLLSIGGNVNGNLYIYTFAPTRMADFLCGMVGAELLLSTNIRAWRLGALADLSAVLICVGALVFPYEGRQGRDMLGMSGVTPLMVLLLVASSCSGYGGWGKSLVVRLAEHPALTSLGGYSFAVYLWQQPVIFVMQLVGPDVGSTPSLLLSYLLALHLWSGLWSVYVDVPAGQKIKAWSERVFKAKPAGVGAHAKADTWAADQRAQSDTDKHDLAVETGVLGQFSSRPV